MNQVKVFLRHGTSPLLALVTGVISHPVFAAPGDILRTVQMPAQAQCASGTGTSVAVVPGWMVGLNQIPILLVTSCYTQQPTPQTGNLYFLNPSTSPATLVGTITTSAVPPSGWGALALRGDRQDLIGCGNNPNGTHAVYAINMNQTGTANFLFNAAAGSTICDGLAWDASAKTVFQNRSQGTNVYRFRETGTFLGSFPFPANCPSSGLATGGTNGSSLYAACAGNLTFNQLNKTNGSAVNSFASVDNTLPRANQRTEDLECDTVSFANTRQDVLWAKDAFTNRLLAIEIPYRTCGLGGAAPDVPTQCPDGSTLDSDGDALLDCWETDGIDANGDGATDLRLDAADPNHKDIYLEIDWMALHEPNPTAVGMVIDSFANAPVNNPDGTSGIRLHVQTDEQAVAHNDVIVGFRDGPAGPGVPDFDEVKATRFGTAVERSDRNSPYILNAKRVAFHYVLFAHNMVGARGTSGRAEIAGNDVIVSLGSWTHVNGHNVGNTDEQAGTLMHELGHNLNLLHGGNDDNGCKPNYLSVMNYTLQTDGSFIIGRPLDYSRANLATLDENNLDEFAGIGGAAGTRFAYGPVPFLVAFADQSIDWNRNGNEGEVGVFANINNFGIDGCNGDGTLLTGYDDWGNLLYNFRNTGDFADGTHLVVAKSGELNITDAMKVSPDTDGDRIVNIDDNCPYTANFYQTDKDDNGVGDSCQKKPSQAIDDLIRQVKLSSLPKDLKYGFVAEFKDISRLVKAGKNVLAINRLQHCVEHINADSEAPVNSYGYKNRNTYAKKYGQKRISAKLAFKLVTSVEEAINDVEAEPVPHKGHHHNHHYRHS